ncbi:metallophosphoesterase family protein [Psychromarinibacter sp. C21-152]|uniref:Metallophosphoesterase family protein n=1 Tax=Psychromarinibacter sediminicola TaxID=3033385 RepID=A0AAE3NVI7_9RHOB|nr:metallophosphoesterase family protein [Psychromarinibacter sediminicola]MDF0602806.1 metallophosphoesterase family protein [Psychromarinibacter sediminicola]
MTDRVPDRFAVLADIHGNADALRAVLADIDAQGLDRVVNLGDHFSGPLAAAETAELLAARDITTIRGNHDRSLIQQHPHEMSPSDFAAFSELQPRHIDWLESLSPTAHFGHDVLLCHATPHDDQTYWLHEVREDGSTGARDAAGIARLGRDADFPLILCAHTHLPAAIRLPDGRRIVNPGSVGLPAYEDIHPVPHVMQSGTPDACYAVLDRAGDAWQVSHRRVPYDPARMTDLARRAGRADWAHALATGWLSDD